MGRGEIRGCDALTRAVTEFNSNALVIGGSLGGLFAANLLLREGWDVQVYEHSRADLVGRGAGIITHPEIFACMARIGIAIDESFGVDIPERIAFDTSGRVLGTV